MSRPTTAQRTAKTVAIALCLAYAMLSATVLAASASAATVTYEHVGEKTFEQELAAGQIASATINRRVRSVRLTLKDGRHVLVRYPAHQESRVSAQLKARGVTVAILTKSQATTEAKKQPVHHKLRYIAGGILIAVIVVVAAVLLIDRRRKLRDE
jgi:hypothetical protein